MPESQLKALELSRRLRPELVLMAVRMPTMDGIAATRQIKRELPKTIVLMITAFENPEYLAEALRAGAAGYLLKYASAHELVRAIRGVLSGESPIDPKLSAQLLLRLHRPAHENKERGGDQPSPPASAPSLPEESPKRSLLDALSPREREVLRLMAEGQTNHQIANELFISIHTVKKHVQRAVSKLGVSDRTQAVLLAIELGLPFSLIGC